jgi:predicted MFS family arabinose efflux permease
MAKHENNLSHSSLVILTSAKTITNTAYRMVYPFLPLLSRRLGIPLETAALAVSARGLIGISTPFLAQITSRRGSKSSMMIGMGCLFVGMSVILLWPTFLGLLITLLVSAAGKYILDPTIQAYVGDRVPFSQRGRAIGITEMSWSLAFLLGIPLLGWAISKSTWLVPFQLIAAAALLTIFSLWIMIEKEDHRDGGRYSFLTDLRSLTSSRFALAGIVLTFLIHAGNESFNIVFGAWMEVTFNVEIVALGTMVALLGIADLSAEGIVASLADRVGVRTALIGGVLFSALVALLLPVLTKSLASALVMIFLFYFFFEFSIVSNTTLMTELAPERRGTMMAAVIASTHLGRGFVAWLGPRLFDYGIWANGLMSASFSIAALVLLLRMMRE